MTRFRPRRPSAALVVATIALIVSLGGTSYAAFHLGKNSVGSKQLKNGAVTSQKIKNGAVTGAKLKLAGVTIPSATNATNATNASNANTLGGNPASAFQPAAKVLFASVSTSATGATVDRGQGATGAGRTAPGLYFVSFNRSILGCTWVGTYGTDNTTISSNNDYLTVEGRSVTTPTDVVVHVWAPGGIATDGQGFHLEVLCP